MPVHLKLSGISKVIPLLALFFAIGMLDVKAQEYQNFNPPEFQSNLSGSRFSQPYLSEIPADSSKSFMDKVEGINEFMIWYMKYFPVPFGSYSKETSWLFGLSKYNAFTLGDTSNALTQPSSISFFGYYTLEHQYKLVLSSNIMMPQNKAIWKTEVVYSHYPLQFFGVGNDTPYNNLLTLVTTDFQFRMNYLFKIWKKWYAGPVYQLYNYNDVEIGINIPELPEFALELEDHQGLQSGIGIEVLHEGRDNRLNARKGMYVNSIFQSFNKAFGSDFDYTNFELDFRYYTPLSEKLTWANLLRTQIKKGEVPVQTLSFIGGAYFMRGIYEGRYRDNIALETQTEVRFPIFWIFGGVVFGGLGQVQEEYNKLGMGEFHYNYGAGLRLNVDPEHDVNLRFDLGFSNESPVFIMNFSEAF